MASLSAILGNRVAAHSTGDANIEKGEIYYYTPGNSFTGFWCNLKDCNGSFCWRAPGCGKAVIEIWGASGSSSRSCCCGAGLPGNPGAYARKIVEFTCDGFVDGCVGMSCGQGDACLCRGVSLPTRVTICHGGGDLRGDTSYCNCLCAQGGYAGPTYCINASSNPFCCLVSICYPGTNYDGMGVGCGIVCNIRGPSGANCTAKAYGTGERLTLKDGGISCTTFTACRPNCWCCEMYHVMTSPGIISEDGVMMTFMHGGSSTISNGGMDQATGWIPNMLTLASKIPTQGNLAMLGFCNCTYFCACYENDGCFPLVPVGVPAAPANPCANVRTAGRRGGHGAVRIKWLGN